MAKPLPLRDSHLFTVRLWAEAADDGQVEWRGRLEHVLSGEAHYFRDWPALISALTTMLAQHAGDAERASPGDNLP